MKKQTECQLQANLLDAVKKDPLILQFIDKQTEELCLAAVERNPDAAKYININIPNLDQILAAFASEPKSVEVQIELDEQLTAVKRNGMVLGLVREQRPELCLAAVQENGLALQFVRVQTHDVCLAAVQEQGDALAYVKEQTPEICLAAVEQNPWALQYVKQLTNEMVMAAISRESGVADVIPVARC